MGKKHRKIVIEKQRRGERVWGGEMSHRLKKRLKGGLEKRSPCELAGGKGGG